jgi:hypothetical protein
MGTIICLQLNRRHIQKNITLEEISKLHVKNKLGFVPTGDLEAIIKFSSTEFENEELWRYMIGDTITFTSLTPHKFKITGRTKYFINAFGEEIIQDNAEKALHTACEHTGAHIKDYTAGPIYMSGNKKGSHEWVIEFEKDPDDLDRFADVLDKTLCSINSDYEAKRFKNSTLVKPTVIAAKRGTFYKWFMGKGKLGGQNKMPRLANDRKYLEEIHQIIS